MHIFRHSLSGSLPCFCLLFFICAAIVSSLFESVSSIQLFPRTKSKGRPDPANNESLLTFNGESPQKVTFGAILPRTSLITLQRQYYKVSDVQCYLFYYFCLLTFSTFGTEITRCC